MGATKAVRLRTPGSRLLPLVAAVASLGLLPGGTAAAEDFTNPAPIATPLPGPPPGCPFPSGCPSEKGTPYPSDIVVAGLRGAVVDVDVTLRDLTYRFDPSDADVMVVAPDAKAVLLMSDACGDNSDENANPIEDPISLTFDDQASAGLPADGACSSGTFRPLDDDEDSDEFPLHMHPDDFFPDARAQPTAAALSTFDGIDPNGTWSLYLVDDGPNDPDPAGNAGRIAGGWTISVTTSATAGGGAPPPTSAPPETTTSTPPPPEATTTTTIVSTDTTAPAPEVSLALTPNRAAPRDRVTVSGDGLEANQVLELGFFSTPVPLGRVTTSEAGTFRTTVTIPANAEAGTHEITATDPAGRTVAGTTLTVVLPQPASGAGRTVLGLLALALLAAVSIGLVWIVRSSRAAQAAGR